MEGGKPIKKSLIVPEDENPSFIVPPSSFDLTIALAKGRMQEGALSILEKAGVRVNAEALASRRLAIEDESGRFRFIFVKPADVPVYVEHGIADCGVVGRDVLLESGADVLQPLDLGINRCRIVVAAKTNVERADFGMLHVATKYPRIATAHFGARGVPVEIIQLSGSVELAPVLGLADCIVDLVETGRTLVENGLSVVETIAESTGRFVVNRASFQLKAAAIAELIKALSEAVEEKSSAENSVVSPQ
jgi:ATP phosphoribosyltransferase